MSIGLKIKELRSVKKITQKQLSDKSGISKRMISAYEADENDIPLSKLRNIASSLGVSIVYLVSDNNTSDSEEVLKDNTLTKAIPLVNVTAVGGFGNESFSISEEDIQDYYVIPKFKYRTIDFMIEVSGVSMSPRYIGGDIVACQIVKNMNFVQWNRVHVIATREQGIILKRIRQGSSDNNLTLVADNSDYPPFEIPKSEITGLALVAGGVTID